MKPNLVFNKKSILKNQMGMSLVEVVITSAVMVVISMAAMQVISDSNSIFTKSMDVVSGHYDEQIFFKNLIKHLENSSIIRGGIIACENDSLKSDQGAAVGISVEDNIILKDVGQTLSFIWRETSTFGIFDNSTVYDYLNALTYLKELENQKNLWDKMRDTVSDLEYESLEKKITDVSDKIDTFEFSSDDFSMNILDTNRFNVGDKVIIAAVVSPTYGGVYEITAIDRESNQMSFKHSDIPETFKNLETCSITDNKEIKDIIMSASSHGAIAGSSVKVTKLVFVEYKVMDPEQNRNERPDFVVSYHSLDGENTKMRIPMFHHMKIYGVWRRLSTGSTLNLSGDYSGTLELKRKQSSHNGMLDVTSRGQVTYAIEASTRSNFDVSTSPRSSDPIAPSAAPDVGPIYPGIICDDFTSCERKYSEYPEQFFRVSASLTDNSVDVSFTVEGQSGGLECWGSLNDESSVQYDEDTKQYRFLKSSGQIGQVTLTKDYKSSATRTFEANCHFKRVESNKKAFEAGYKPKDVQATKVRIKMSYYDFNSSTMKNQTIGVKTVPIYTGQKITPPEDGSCKKPGFYSLEYDSFNFSDSAMAATKPIFRTMCCKNGVDCTDDGNFNLCIKDDLGNYTTNIQKVRFYPKFNMSSNNLNTVPDYDYYEIDCEE